MTFLQHCRQGLIAADNKPIFKDIRRGVPYRSRLPSRISSFRNNLLLRNKSVKSEKTAMAKRMRPW
jgi:hypothetical protein